jgi:general L-amino acid transport system substrate-binding protein
MNRFGKVVCAVLAGIGGLMAGDAGAESSTVKKIQARGKLLCSAPAGGYLGFYEVDDKGQWKGLEADLCRGVSIALFGTPDKASPVPVSFAQRFPALQSGDIDVIFMVTTWTLQRDTALGFQFSNPYFFGGSQFMVKKSVGVKSATELNGATICTIAGTTTERLLVDFMDRNKLTYKVVAAEKAEETREAYLSGRCDALIGWGPGLASFRVSKAKIPDEHVILPEILTNEPIAAVVRQDDDGFLDIVNWTIAALIEAEDLGVTAKNVDEMKKSANMRVKRLLGVTPGVGKALGLPEDWAYNVIKKLGNFAELYDKSLGSASPYKLDRGLNKLWNKGGLLMTPVFD